MIFKFYSCADVTRVRVRERPDAKANPNGDAPFLKQEGGVKAGYGGVGGMGSREVTQRASRAASWQVRTLEKMASPDLFFPEGAARFGRPHLW